MLALLGTLEKSKAGVVRGLLYVSIAVPSGC